MTSKECFVFIQLPNSLDVVTVGKFRWQKQGANSEVGAFVYGRSYLNNPKAIALDPFHLPLEDKEFRVTLNEGVHGPIRDSSPDSWGRYVIQKILPPDQHDPIGYLLNSSDDRIGALSFNSENIPPVGINFSKPVNLKNIIEAANKLVNDLALDSKDKELLMAGPSAGGARPKTTVEISTNQVNQLWIAKFPAVNDKQNYPKIEFATMKFAKHCGLNVPEIDLVKVGSQDVFLIQRFDRVFDAHSKKYFRHHFVSALTLMNLDENDFSNWSYLELADQMRRWIKDPKLDLIELFKRIVFNGLISNTDDHPRNHGFINSGNGYALSPVYDLLPKPEFGTFRYLAMGIGNEGKVFTKNNLFSNLDAFDLNSKQAESILNNMITKISQWRSFYKKLNFSESELTFLENAFNHQI